jgi:hypothetical protein
MTKERGLTDYLNDWNMPDQSGDSRKSASGADSEGTDNEHAGIPFSWNMPPSPRWGMQTENKNDGGYGHSADVEDSPKSVSWGMDKDEIAKGYSSPKSDGEGGVLETRQSGGSFEQSIPVTNEWDRQEAYSRAHNDTGVHSGEGTTKNRTGFGTRGVI